MTSMQSNNHHPQIPVQAPHQQHLSEGAAIGISILASLDIIDMLGLKKAPEKEQKNFLLQFSENVFVDFLTTKIQYYLTPEEWQEFVHLLDTRASQEDLFSFLAAKVPHIPTLLYYASIEYKKTFFLQFLHSLEHSYDKQVKAARSKKKKEGFQQQLNLIHHLIHHAEQDQWQEVQGLLPRFDA